MLSEADILTLSASHWRRSPNWWERDAYQAIVANRFQMIYARSNRSEIYLVRMWLVQAPPMGQDERFESGSQAFLHFFARGDDDQSLHDHPWNFTTRLLAGSYVENLPPEDWDRSSGVGPAWDERTVAHYAGQTVHHQAEDLHCVSSVKEGTFTLVSTGPRIRPWGFHAPGRPWMGHQEYLDFDRTTQTPEKDLIHG